MTPAQVAHIMPPLPESALWINIFPVTLDKMLHSPNGFYLFNADQMREYARAAVEAELRRLDAREAELLALLRQANERLIDNRDDPLIVAIHVATRGPK